MNISDEAAEAAAKELHGWEDHREEWADAELDVREYYLDQARSLLIVAAPHLLAVAWDVCAGAVEAATRLVAPDEITPMGARIINKTTSRNPYRTEAHK